MNNDSQKTRNKIIIELIAAASGVAGVLVSLFALLSDFTSLQELNPGIWTLPTIFIGLILASLILYFIFRQISSLTSWISSQGDPANLSKARENFVMALHITVTLVLDVSLFVFWLAVQWFVNGLINSFISPDLVDSLEFNIFQILFAISTILPVIIFTGFDVVTIVLRIQNRIKTTKGN